MERRKQQQEEKDLQGGRVFLGKRNKKLHLKRGGLSPEMDMCYCDQRLMRMEKF